MDNPRTMVHPTSSVAPNPGISQDEHLDAAGSSPLRDLELLQKVSAELVSILDRQELLERVGKLIKGLIDYQLFSVLLLDERTRKLESVLSVRWGGCKSEKITASVDHGLLGVVATTRQPIRVPDVRLDPRYVSCGDEAVRSELAVPMLIEDRLIGVLDFESYHLDAFSEDNERLITILASSLAIALENATLYERVKRNEERLAADLETAREMQRFLLPRATPWLPELQTAVAYMPARHLGGDLYDFLSYGEGRTAIAVGDVAGKGTSAALYGSLAIGLLRGYMSDNRCAPSCVLAYLNEELRQVEAEKRFLALAFAVYDRATNTLSIANAGLPYPYLIRDGQAQEVEVSGLPVGSLAHHEYRHVDLALDPGDVVVFTSDGIAECLDPEDQPFGDDRVKQTLERLATSSAQDIANGLLAATDAHGCGKCEPSDDRTVVVLRVGEA